MDGSGIYHFYPTSDRINEYRLSFPERFWVCQRSHRSESTNYYTLNSKNNSPFSSGVKCPMCSSCNTSQVGNGGVLGSDDIEKEEKFLLHSIDSIQDLYLIMLSSLIEIRKKEVVFLEASSKKHLVTPEEKNPNKKCRD